jgi:TonB-linked SusC/RagA family outer membrane protein
MEKLKLLLLVFMVIFASFASAQDITSGILTDEQNMPIPGVNILVKGTTKGTLTDFDGKYTIAASDGDVLIFSYIGYTTVEVKFTGQSSLDVQLLEDTAKLGEVVVIGYGDVKRTDLTGAVASLSASNITAQKKTDIGQALKGQASGVDVRSLSNKPGAPLQIRIRGNTAIRNDAYVSRDGTSDDATVDRSKPLYVVDGIFFEDINILNPNDIQQMDILKDASATAIYGSRGANGVVIITTKNGVEGKTVFTYEASVGVSSVANEPDYFTGEEYVSFVGDVIRSNEWKKLFNTGTPSVADYNNINITPFISQEIRTTNEEANNVANGRFTNWREKFQKTGLQTSHNLRLSGGSNGLVYNASLGILSDEGVVGTEAFERYNLSASVSKKVTDKFTVGLKTYLAYSDREQGSAELYRSTQRLPPTVNSRDVLGNVILFPDDQDLRFANPYYDANGAWDNNTKSMDVIANVFLDYKPKDWISFKTQFAPNIKNTRQGEYRGLFTKSSRNDQGRIRAYYNQYFNTSYSWDNIVNLNFDVTDGHNLNATLVSSVYYNQREWSNIERRNFDTDAYSFYNIESGLQPRADKSEYIKETLASYTARLNYSIQDKYLFTFSGRYDGSSKLAVNNKWAFFPAAAFAWKASDEDFLQSTDWLSNLKFRLSYGESGNDTSANAYGSLALLGQSDYLFGATLANGTYVTRFSNSGLVWERSKEFNIGVDLGILDNKVRLGIEIYNKKTVGSILGRTLSPITGFNNATGNYGSIGNKGVEITLNTRNIRTDNFSWTTNLNFSKNNNEILDLDGSLDLIPYENHGVLQVGQPADAIWTYEKLGIYQLDEVAEAAKYNRFPGEYKFKDQNNDGVLDNDDKVVIGQLSPDWIAGMTNTFSYKNLDISIQAYTRQGSVGHSEFYQNSVPWQHDQAKFNKVNLDYWTPNNQGSQNPAVGYGGQGTLNTNSYYQNFDFVRIGNIGLGYQFNQPMLDKLKMSSLSLSLDIQNPFTFTDYAGSDPETGLQNNYRAGYLMKTVLFGLKVSY